MSQAYFDGDEYGWEEEIAQGIPDVPSEWDAAADQITFSGATSGITSILGSRVMINAYQSLLAEQLNRPNPLMHYVDAELSTTTGTYGGITRSNAVPTHTWGT